MKLFQARGTGRACELQLRRHKQGARGWRKNSSTVPSLNDGWMCRSGAQRGLKGRMVELGDSYKLGHAGGWEELRVQPQLGQRIRGQIFKQEKEGHFKPISQGVS
jgi:hypothetical protein